MGIDTAPFIITLQLDEEAFQFFNTLRRQHFPPDRNYLDAHLTLFHHITRDRKTVGEVLSSMSSTLSIFELEVSSVVTIGRGVAYKVESDVLQKLHQRLKQEWFDILTPQDKQRLWPHVTIQNKVDGETARNLFQQLTAGFVPFVAYGLGLQLWEYAGGPWKFCEEFPFKPKTEDPV